MKLSDTWKASNLKLQPGSGSNLMSSLVCAGVPEIFCAAPGEKHRAGNAAVEAPIGLKERELTEYLQSDLRVDVRRPRRNKQR